MAVCAASKLLEHKPFPAIDMAKGIMEIESSVDTRAPLRIAARSRRLETAHIS
jgi:hypothetical protein